MTWVEDISALNGQFTRERLVRFLHLHLRDVADVRVGAREDPPSVSVFDFFLRMLERELGEDAGIRFKEIVARNSWPRVRFGVYRDGREAWKFGVRGECVVEEVRRWVMGGARVARGRLVAR